MSLIDNLKSGAVLRYREGFGFYTVKGGKSIPTDQKEAEAAIRSRQIQPEGAGPDKFGVRHFALRRG